MPAILAEALRAMRPNLLHIVAHSDANRAKSCTESIRPGAGESE